MPYWLASVFSAVASLFDATTHAVFEFRESAIQVLGERALLQTRPTAFVCINIDNRPPNVLQLLSLRAAVPRDLGHMNECRCYERRDRQICRHTASNRPACRLSIGKFALENPRKGTATYLLSCGWPDGWGELAVLAKPSRAWGYAGNTGFILL